MTRSTSSRLVATAAALVLHALTACSSGGDPLAPPTLGGIALSVSGLPAGGAAAIQVAGPGGYSLAVASSTTLDGLVPGQYSISASPVTANGSTWLPAPATQAVDVPASASRVPAAVAYGVPIGSLVVTITGLPAGTDAAVTVTGAAGYTAVVSVTDTLEGLVAGTYTVTAANLTAGPSTWAAAPQSQSVQVVANVAAAATVTYAVFVPGSVNLRIDGMNLTQSVQSYSDTIPLVSGRDALLRVFVRADQPNTVAPNVRVRLYAGANPAPVETWTIPAPGASTPLGIDEGTLASSWNLLVPGALLLPDARLLADVDPGNGFGESDETDNTFPLSGTARALVVRAANPLSLRFISVVVQGSAGDVTPANVDAFTVTMRKVFPLRSVSADVRSQSFTSSAATLQPGSSAEWGQVLSEVNALRSADAWTGYYYGVVHTNYSSGIAGIGYVPGRAAIGWERLPSADGVMAHEFGHNLSLSHAPCGGVSNPDPSFPRPDGSTGAYGLDLTTMTLKPPTAKDLMGYCGGTQWISEYHYLRAFNYRSSNPQAARAGALTEGLLIWGRVVDGRIDLEPAFPVAVSQGPASGRYVAQALDATGRLMAQQAFDASVVADIPGDHQHFAVVLPLTAAQRVQVARLRVRGPGAAAVAERASATALRSGAAGVAMMRAPVGRSLERTAAGAARLRWDDTAWPMAVVRDATTGAILAFARGGDMTLAAPATALDVTWSDGVQGVSERLP